MRYIMSSLMTVQHRGVVNNCTQDYIYLPYFHTAVFENLENKTLTLCDFCRNFSFLFQKQKACCVTRIKDAFMSSWKIYFFEILCIKEKPLAYDSIN